MNKVRVVPFYQAAINADMFTDATKVSPHEVDVNGVKVLTAPLKPGVPLNLLGFSYNQALYDTGAIDHSDCLDARILLSTIYVEVNGEVVVFDVSSLNGTAYTKAFEGSFAEMGISTSFTFTNPELTITVRGQLNVQTGNLIVNFDAGINATVIGYELLAHRYNPNRR